MCLVFMNMWPGVLPSCTCNVVSFFLAVSSCVLHTALFLTIIFIWNCNWGENKIKPFVNNSFRVLVGVYSDHMITLLIFLNRNKAILWKIFWACSYHNPKITRKQFRIISTNNFWTSTCLLAYLHFQLSLWWF